MEYNKLSEKVQKAVQWAKHHAKKIVGATALIAALSGTQSCGNNNSQTFHISKGETVTSLIRDSIWLEEEIKQDPKILHLLASDIIQKDNKIKNDKTIPINKKITINIDKVNNYLNDYFESHSTQISLKDTKSNDILISPEQAENIEKEGEFSRDKDSQTGQVFINTSLPPWGPELAGTSTALTLSLQKNQVCIKAEIDHIKHNLDFFRGHDLIRQYIFEWNPSSLSIASRITEKIKKRHIQDQNVNEEKIKNTLEKAIQYTKFKSQSQQ